MDCDSSPEPAYVSEVANSLTAARPLRVYPFVPLVMNNEMCEPMIGEIAATWHLVINQRM